MEKRRIFVLTVLLSLCAATFAQGLKDVYKDYFLIGAAVNQRNVTNAEQQALIKREFSSMTAENDNSSNSCFVHTSSSPSRVTVFAFRSSVMPS